MIITQIKENKILVLSYSVIGCQLICLSRFVVRLKNNKRNGILIRNNKRFFFFRIQKSIYSDISKLLFVNYF